MRKYLVLAVLIVGVYWFWQRTATALQIAYLGWDEANVVQLFVVDPGGSGAQQLTSHEPPAAIFDFAVAPDGQRIAYSLVMDDGGSEVWVMGRNGRSARPIHTCPTTLCTDLVWHPQQNRLLFEQREDEGTPSFLWWLDVDSGETAPLLVENNRPGLAPRFSPDSEWVSYVSPQDGGIVLYHFATGEDQMAASLVGSPAAWQPAGDGIVVSDLDVTITHEGSTGDDHDAHGHDTSEAIHLFQVELATGERLRLTEVLNADDGVAAVSPDGLWVAFGRRAVKTAVGRQLWLVAADGTQAHALTNELAVHHGPPRWSPDGSLLLFQRFDAENGGKSAVFTLELETGMLREVVGEGMQPAWLP